MNTFAILAASILAVAKADFAGDASAVIETASVLSSLVAGWSKDQGLSGALAIQETYDPLSKAVSSLVSSSSDGEVNEANIKALGDLASGVAGLLSALTEKAGDFSAVGADKIVQGDISQLAGPSAEIVSKVYEKGKSDCEAISALQGPLSSLNDAFQSAASAYSASAPSFPEIKCEGDSSDSNSSSAASSSESQESTSETSTASGSSSESSKAATSEAKPTSGVAPANGAVTLGSSALAMVAALLI